MTLVALSRNITFLLNFNERDKYPNSSFDSKLKVMGEKSSHMLGNSTEFIHLNPFSILQFLSQPSPSIRFPSSHSIYNDYTLPFPHYSIHLVLEFSS